MTAVDHVVPTIGMDPNMLLACTTGLIGLIGVPGNICIICLSVASRNLRTQPHFLLVMQLAAADLIFCLNNCLMQSHQTLDVLRQPLLCQVAGYIEYVSGLTSFIVIPTIALNRYAVFHQHTRASCMKVFNLRSVAFFGALSWFFSAAIFLPYPLTSSLGIDEVGLCGVQLSSPTLHIYWVVACAGPILLSYSIVLCCYSHIITRLHSHRRSSLTTATIRDSRDLMRMMLLMCALPLMAQLPAVVFKALAPLLSEQYPWLSRAIVAPFPLTSACNPYIVLAVVKPYKMALRKAFGQASPSSSVIRQQRLEAVYNLTKKGHVWNGIDRISNV